MRHVAGNSRVAAATWDGAEPLAVGSGVLAIRVASPGQENSIKRSRRDVMLRNILVETFGIDLIVEASASPVPPPPADIASEDDPDDDDPGISGIDLAMRELGAVKIGEIDSSDRERRPGG
jgi:hypothetical protein